MFCNIHKTKILHGKEIKQVNPKGNHWKDSMNQWSKCMNQRNQWIKYSLEGLMLKLQYFGHLMQRTDSLGKDPDAGKDWRQEEKRGAEDKMVSSITESMDMNLCKHGETVKDREVWNATVYGIMKSGTQLND